MKQYDRSQEGIRTHCIYLAPTSKHKMTINYGDRMLIFVMLWA
jgi:hypothetical protein